MQLMRRHDPQKQQDGVALMRAHAAEHLDELIAEFHHEPDWPEPEKWPTSCESRSFRLGAG